MFLLLEPKNAILSFLDTDIVNNSWKYSYPESVNAAGSIQNIAGSGYVCVENLRPRSCNTTGALYTKDWFKL